MHSGTDPVVHKTPRDSLRIAGSLLFIVPKADVVAGGGEGRPGEVEPAGAGQQLVGIGAVAEEIDQALELARVLGADVGSLSEQVL